MPSERSLSFHTWATAYCTLGFSVIPLIGKRPALESWRPFQDRRPSRSELRRWFAGDENIGIVTGRLSGLVVVDCDSPADALYWRQHFPQTPVAALTGGGGVHFYYRYPDSGTVGNRVKLLSRRIDLRADGGYVVAPPSRHSSGLNYTWTSPGHLCLDDVPYFSPGWIADKTDRVGFGTPRTALRRPLSYIRAIHAISGQRGHDQTFRVACTLREAGLTPEEVLCELIEWNKTNADPPWSTRELLHKVQSAFQSL